MRFVLVGGREGDPPLQGARGILPGGGQGIKAIKRTYHRLDPSQVYRTAIEIYRNGHQDHIDALYYTTVEETNTSLLTIDYKLIKFLERFVSFSFKEYKTKGIILTPKEPRKTQNNK